MVGTAATVSLQQLPQVPTHTDQQLSRRDKFLNLRRCYSPRHFTVALSSAQKKVICAKNKESPAVLPTVDYDRPLATTSQTTSKNVRPLTLSSKIPVSSYATLDLLLATTRIRRDQYDPTSPDRPSYVPEAQLEEICDQMQALDIQASAFRQINIDLWDNDITRRKGQDRSNDICGKVHIHRYDLLEWTEDTWDRARMNTREPSETTKERGIYTEQEFTEMVFDERTAAFRRQTALLGSNASTNPHPSQPPSPSVTPLAAPHQGLNEPQPIKTLTSPPNAPTPAPTIQDKPAPTSLTIHPTSYRFQNPDLVNRHQPHPRTLIRPCNLWRIHETPRITSRTLSSIATSSKFMKTWNKDRNYTGEPYDLLDDKLRLFLSNCSHIQVKPAQRFYLDKITWATTFRQAYDIFKQHFDTEVNHVHYHTDWTTITFNSIRAQDASKTPHEVLQILFDKLQLCQRALGREYAGDLLLRTTLMKACRGVPELQYALFKPADNVEHLLADLRASVETHLALITTSRFPLTLLDHLIITIHTISTTSTVDTITTALEVDTDIQVNDPAADTDKATTVETTGLKAVVTTIIATVTETGRRSVLFVDKKAVGQLNTLRMNGKGQDQHITQCHFIGVQLTDIGGYILDYEGHEMSSFDDTEDTWEEHDNSTNDHPEQWQASQMLCQQAFNHLITGEDVYQTDQTVVQPPTFSTAGYSQYIALQREDPSVALDSSTSGQASIKFGNSDAIHSLGTVALNTPLGRITFHVLQTPTPFLLCLADMDRLGIYFNNITDTINCTNHCTNRPTSIPVVRKWGHPWFFLTKDEESISFLTETEIRTLHRRFGHPAVPRLHHLLKQAGHTPPLQEHHNALFYTLWTQLLLSKSQIFTVNTLRTLWIDTYLGPPDTLRHDAGTNFASLEFRNEAKIMESNALKYLLRRIGPLERLNAITHPSDAPLTSSMLRLATPLPPKQSFKWLLKQSMIRQDLTVLCLRCLFSAHTLAYLQTRPFRFYPQRSEAMQKAMKMLRQLSAERRVKDALHARNGPSTTEVLSSRCKVKFAFGEKDGWQGPFKIASIDTHNITIDTVNGPKSFDRPLYNRICVMIPLFPTLHDTDPQAFVQILMNNRLKTPGRPPGSKNKPKDLIMMAQAVDQSFLTQRRKMHSSFPQATNPITKITDLVGAVYSNLNDTIK
ncbi:DUF1421 multi-domain protein [Hirsutella rhossiliensis]